MEFPKMFGLMCKKSLILSLTLLATYNRIAKAQDVEKVDNVRSPFSSTIVEISQKQKDKEKLLQTNRCPDCDLSEVDLSGLNLRNAFLPRANLQKANLIGTDLRGAFLQEAKLQEAKLINADLRGANLNFADLTNANLTYANLSTKDHPIPPSENREYRDYSPTRLFKTELQGATLNDSELERAFAPYACFEKAKLRRANLSEIDLRDAIIRDADLSGVFNADLQDFSLFGNLGANLQKAKLDGASFSGSDLRGANFKDAENASLSSSLTSRAILPDGTLDFKSNPRITISDIQGNEPNDDCNQPLD